jgi:hypothetical protein
MPRGDSAEPLMTTAASPVAAHISVSHEFDGKRILGGQPVCGCCESMRRRGLCRRALMAPPREKG